MLLWHDDLQNLDNNTELYMTKYIIVEIFSSGGATLYKNPSDQTVQGVSPHKEYVVYFDPLNSSREHDTTCVPTFLIILVWADFAVG